MRRLALRLSLGSAAIFVASLLAILTSRPATQAWAQHQGRAAGAGAPMQSSGEEGGGGDGLTCGWCIVVADSTWHADNPLDPESWYWDVWIRHYFPSGGDGCTSAQPAGASCVRCGSTAAPCHANLDDPDHCHIACGGELLAKVGEEIEAAIGSGDVRAVARLVMTRHEKFAAVFIPAGGRIAINADCDRSAPARQYPVPVAMRDALRRLLAA